MGLFQTNFFLKLIGRVVKIPISTMNKSFSPHTSDMLSSEDLADEFNRYNTCPLMNSLQSIGPSADDLPRNLSLTPS